MTVTPEMVKALRERAQTLYDSGSMRDTGLGYAGVIDCKRALEATGGDMDQAIERLRDVVRAKGYYWR